MKKTFEIEVTWAEAVRMTISADTKEEAMKIAEESKTSYPSKSVIDSFKIEAITEIDKSAGYEHLTYDIQTISAVPREGSLRQFWVKVTNQWVDAHKQLRNESKTPWLFYRNYYVQGDFEGRLNLIKARLYYLEGNEAIFIRELNPAELRHLQTVLDFEKKYSLLKVY